jgi:hypothetical protein
MNSIEISYLGSACGKNRYEPKEKMMLLLLCREYKNYYKDIFFKCGAFQLLDPTKKTYDTELKRIYSKMKKEIGSPGDFKKTEEEITKKLKVENKDITEEDIAYASKFLESSFKKDCGINNEQSIITQKEYKKGNNRIYYYSENNWTIKGFHDASYGDVVIEIKTRMREQNVRKNEYDLYQLFGYLLAMNKTNGKIVQKFSNRIYDSDIETQKEYGLIDITTDPWKTKFKVFKAELNGFFSALAYYNETTFNITAAINMSDLPIAVFDIDGIPHNVNPSYEKIVKALT